MDIGNTLGEFFDKEIGDRFCDYMWKSIRDNDSNNIRFRMKVMTTLWTVVDNSIGSYGDR